jgi:beta-1,4-mannosyltransferase
MELQVGAPTAGHQAGPLVVLESFGPPHPLTNPYLTLLYESFPPPIQALHFTWRRAILGRYDVFHLHWPEVLLLGRTRPRTVARCLLFAVILLRIRVGRLALVRTLHEPEPHEAPSRIKRRLIALSTRWTTLWVTLNEVTPPPSDAPTVLAPIGHYRGWLPAPPSGDPVPGRLLYFGRIRRYKGLDSLVPAFLALPDQSTSLHLVGLPADAALAEEVRSATDTEPRITAYMDYVPDEVLVRELRESELVVLPFARITNSSSVILALTLDRPVLVPAIPLTQQLADEVGHEWVVTYAGELDGEVLAAALATVRAPRVQATPDLSRREWSEIGQAHLTAFQSAVAHARGAPLPPAVDARADDDARAS